MPSRPAIRLLLHERDSYSLNAKIDSAIRKLPAEKNLTSEIDIILPLAILNTDQMRELRSKLSKYSVACIFSIPAIHQDKDTPVNFIFLRFTKEKREIVKAANFFGTVRPSGTDGLSRMYRTPEYDRYLDSLENWEYSEQIPKSISGVADYSEIPVEKFDSENLNPAYYHSKAVGIRERLCKKDVSSLCDVADIITPNKTTEEGKVFNPKTVTYPINPKKLISGKRSDTVLQKGDIVISAAKPGYMGICLETGNEKIYAPPLSRVIRPKTVSPEYLFLYLESETRKVISVLFTDQETVTDSISVKNLANLPVILPNKTNEEYEQIFKAEKYPINLRDIDRILFSSSIESPSCTADILNQELFENLKIYKHKTIVSRINKDWAEFSQCLRFEEYKKTLILTELLLKKVLIGWLSEFDKKNGFEDKDCLEKDLKEYMNHLKKVHPDGKEVRWCKYIQKIYNSINLSPEESDLKEYSEINEKLCRDVIRYLQAFVEERFRYEYGDISFLRFLR